MKKVFTISVGKMELRSIVMGLWMGLLETSSSFNLINWKISVSIWLKTVSLLEIKLIFILV